jgi:hypothetical protein
MLIIQRKLCRYGDHLYLTTATRGVVSRFESLTGAHHAASQGRGPARSSDAMDLISERL